MIIKLKVKPNSDEDNIEKVIEGEYIVSVREPAEDNKANKKVVNILSKELGISFRKIRIKNPKSTEKIVEIID